MNPVHANQLVQGNMYLIECPNPGPGYSSQKIGVFDHYEPYNGPYQIFGRVFFTNLRDVPGDPRRSWLGSNSDNVFPDVFRFTEYYPDANSANAGWASIGGRRRRSKRSRKSRKSKRSRKSRRGRK